MKIMIVIVIFLSISTNLFAIETKDLEQYKQKSVLLIYRQNGIEKADICYMVRIIHNENDYTFDKIYTYIIFVNYRAETILVKVNEIKSIELIRR